MLVTFKTVTQITFRLDIDEKQKIIDVKNRISAEQGETEYPVESMKLIYNGRVLADEETFQDVNVESNKFVVVMVTRKKPPPVATLENKDSRPSSNVSDIAQTTTASTDSITNSTASVALHSENFSAEHTDMVESIVAMGYERENVIRALKASFFNADRAVEYLCSSIPDIEDDDVYTANATNEESGTGGASLDLEQIRSLPHFAHLRAVVQSDPTLLPQAIEQIARYYPHLLEAITNNQEEFVNMMNSESTPPRSSERNENVRNRPSASRRVTVPLSDGDRAAIDRLKAMGFPEQLVIEAYLSCDKNEDFAVNYILQRLDETVEEINEYLDNPETGEPER